MCVDTYGCEDQEINKCMRVCEGGGDKEISTSVCGDQQINMCVSVCGGIKN